MTLAGIEDWKRERIVLLALLAAGAVASLLGLVDRPAPATGDEAVQLLDVVRLFGTVALTITLVFGPGTAWRALNGPGSSSPSLAFLAVPGLLLLAAVGGAAWGLHDQITPRSICFGVFLPVQFGLAGILLTTPREPLFSPEERRCLLIVGIVLGYAVGKALWSLGPAGELYGGTVSRTLEVGDRSDSRISYIIPQLTAHGEAPFGPVGAALYAPYNFSSRGPLPGLASSPVVFLTGGHPPNVYPEEPWQPFDEQGFAAYRAAMMVFATTSFLALWDLIRRLAGGRAARFGLLLAATTPFLVHEVWFTWPKLLAAAFVLMGAICVISRRPFLAGCAVGLGYLMHPVALLSVPVLGLIALWPLIGANWKRPRIGQAVLLGLGLAGFLIAWRLVNGSHYDQSGFIDYFHMTGLNLHPTLGGWIVYRAKSLANTVVPFLLPFASADSPSINVYGGISPPVIHFFFMYWDTVPFGVAITFLPLLLLSLWRSLRRWPWAISATVIFPFIFFVVYWGSSVSGLTREGLHTWVLTLFVVVACEQAASGFGWLRSRAVRVVLMLRVVEVLAMTFVPTLATRHELFGDAFELSDFIALATMLGCGALLGWLVWREPPPPEDAAAPDQVEGDAVQAKPAPSPA